MKKQIESEIRKAFQKVIGTYNITIPDSVVEEAGVAVMAIVNQWNINFELSPEAKEYMDKILNKPTAQTTPTPTAGDISPSTDTAK